MEEWRNTLSEECDDAPVRLDWREIFGWLLPVAAIAATVKFIYFMIQYNP
jgi:hypothetical protein